jgi:hypothetical protein
MAVDPVARARAEKGLTEALDRVRGRAGHTDGDDPLVSVADALAWCHRLDEAHAKAHGSTYYANRDAAPDGRALGGLIYARNLLDHHLATVGELVYLSRFLHRQGIEVIEVDRANRQVRRQGGKSDPADAVEAARAAQSGRARGWPRRATETSRPSGRCWSPGDRHGRCGSRRCARSAT